MAVGASLAEHLLGYHGGMDPRQMQIERAQNLWERTVAKQAPLERAATLVPAPDVTSARIGGLEQAQEEVLTYACATTNPEVYAHWGTFPPTGLLLIGPPGCGKRLLAEALATRAGTGFLQLRVPRLAIEIVHYGGKVAELLEVWSTALAEMPPLTVFFEELEFGQAQEIGARRTDLPVGPIMDFLQELVDRTIRVPKTLAVASTSHPDTLRPAFVVPGRFERVVDVVPSFPGDVVAALQIHAREAERRAGRALFEDVAWEQVVKQHREASIGDWVRLLHGALRRKARCEAALEPVGPVRTEDLAAEVERFRRASDRLPRVGAGIYV
jgi:SpoVK/Ycf46/Vps4 family AAA+-type ATPase